MLDSDYQLQSNEVSYIHVNAGLKLCQLQSDEVSYIHVNAGFSLYQLQSNEVSFLHVNAGFRLLIIMHSTCQHDRLPGSGQSESWGGGGGGLGQGERCALKREPRPLFLTLFLSFSRDIT